MKSIHLLKNFNQDSSLSSHEIATLLEEDLQDYSFCNAFDITPENGFEKIRNRLDLWEKSYDLVAQYCQQLGFDSLDIMSLLWEFWLPLAIQLSQEKSQQKSTLIQGILGGQGTGKTTLSHILCLILKQLDHQTLTISIDDFYTTYDERQKLKKIDPRFIWRGPPGTHDVELGIKVLNQLKNPHHSDSILIPRFDKSLWNGQGDRIEPEPINHPDIVLFEGWFLGVCPIEQTRFNDAPLPIKTEEDRQFAKDINEKLKAYLPLWEKLDSLIILYPQHYHFSKQWRKEAEHKMISSGKTGMSDQEVEDFVNYFWKALHPELFITPLAQNPNLVDLVITIDKNHQPQQIQQYLKLNTPH
ncbi:unknown [Crocosphaera subtropica ATCC 51142]|uniref:Glycerate kinase n=1 Tax=Crocosphaera subtropica (strain ATCC 51142 / BH68) TaxID=43989 RepID=B1WS83_CROS5|nr:glycerate kinase [Crocosphaera subtropica]ACB51869.1 unknown [Crocosphaera subtropica ATCC 51142]